MYLHRLNAQKAMRMDGDNIVEVDTYILSHMHMASTGSGTGVIKPAERVGGLSKHLFVPV